jgi:hypothetical protein
MSWIDCNRPENETPERALEECKEAIGKVHRAFGAPGNYGYGHPEGDSLQHLYAAHDLVYRTLKKMAAGVSPKPEPKTEELSR